MLKKIFIAIVIFAFSLTSVFAQDANSSSDNSVRPRTELSQNFVNALESQDETLLIQAIETGTPEVKALCFEALAKKGTDSAALVNAINRYVVYGLNAPYTRNSDSLVRYQALKAAAVSKSDTSIKPISEMIYRDSEPSNLIAAAYALGEIGSPQGVPALLFQLRLGKTQGVVYETAVALGKIGDPSALSSLIDLAQDDRYFIVVRQAAVDAIKNIKPVAPGTDSRQTSTTDTTAQ